jgi:hypothetical protein
LNDWSPARCGKCAYEIVPEEIGHGLHPSGHWAEPTTTGWVHSPPGVGDHWHENYDTRDHEAYPHDNRTVVEDYSGANKLMEHLDTQDTFRQIMKNNNLGRQF